MYICVICADIDIIRSDIEKKNVCNKIRVR